MPEMTSTQRQMLALCSLVSASDRCDCWGVLARQAHRERSLDGLVAGDILETSANAHRTGWVIKTASAESSTAAWERADSEYRAATAAGGRLTTVPDDDFPLNLRLIHNLPPFLFYRGGLDADRDAHSVAVVGTRSATPDGIHQARRVVRSLTNKGLTVTSGLAIGIDATAHRETLARDGRTIAVLPSGITRLAPAANRGLGRTSWPQAGSSCRSSSPQPRQPGGPSASATRSPPDQPRHSRDRSIKHVGSPNAGPPRLRARQAGVPARHARRPTALGAADGGAPPGSRRLCIDEITSRIVSPDRVHDVSDLLHVEPALL